MEKLKTRLTNQLRSRGVKNSSEVANRLLENRGQMKNGKLTEKGKEREALGRAGRAKDRSAKYNGGKPADYSYNSNTNRATKRK